MPSPFAASEIAAGYATFRPRLHSKILERISRRLGWRQKFRLALDAGCGAGLSTVAVSAFAEHSIGLESVPAMLLKAKRAEYRSFAVGTAEQIPIRDNSLDLITAAGSLNYVDLDQFFREADRVLKTTGLLVVYDFETGRSFSNSAELDRWFLSFVQRHPFPTGQARELNPEILEGLETGFQMLEYEHFEIGLPMTPDFYIEYMMTETNVAAAIDRGVPREDIRSWCTATLDRVWSAGPRDVMFRGYFACMGRCL